MRKAVNTGIISGLILTVIMILGTILRIYKPADTTGANLTFTIIFLSAIILVLWIAMERYTKTNSFTWSYLNLIAIATTITTAVVFSAASFIYTSFSSKYLSHLMVEAKKNWIEQNYSAQTIASQGEWTWYRTPWNFAFNNLQVMLMVLFVFSLFVAFVYYSKNRSRTLQHDGHNNHELIF